LASAPPQLDFDIPHLQPEFGELLGRFDELDDSDEIVVGKVMLAQAKLRVGPTPARGRRACLFGLPIIARRRESLQ
jgi:hypothetical protein